MDKRALAALLWRVPLLHRLAWQGRRSANALHRRIRLRRPLIDGNAAIERAIRARIPLAAAKVGTVECAGVVEYLARRRTPGRSYSSYRRHALHLNAGVFPAVPEFLDRFFPVFIDAVAGCDLLAAWDVDGEVEVLSGPGRRAGLIGLRDLEPYFSPRPWSLQLEGLRVLVVSPFVDSIRAQYARREQVWARHPVLPAFHLECVRAPFSAGLVPPCDADWLAALARLQGEVDRQPYDVLLAGAGAFSIPLVAHARRAGRIGIHLGGSLQMLFGVLGRRWRDNPDFRPFINDHWRPPAQDETPERNSAVENGSYW